MDQLLKDLQDVLDQLKAANAQPEVDPLRKVVEAQLEAEGWSRPTSAVSVPVTAEDSNDVNEGQ